MNKYQKVMNKIAKAELKECDRRNRKRSFYKMRKVARTTLSYRSYESLLDFYGHWYRGR